MPLALNYDEVKALDPRNESFRRVSKLLGGKKGWNGNRIDAAAARSAGCTFDDIVWAASAIARTDKDAERRLLLWIADCLAHIADVISSPEVRTIFDRCVIAQRRFACGDAAAEKEWEEAAWAAWDARDAEAAWQFDRLIARLSDPEPEDWPLPAVKQAEAA